MLATSIAKSSLRNPALAPSVASTTISPAFSPKAFFPIAASSYRKEQSTDPNFSDTLRQHLHTEQKEMTSGLVADLTCFPMLFYAMLYQTLRYFRSTKIHPDLSEINSNSVSSPCHPGHTPHTQSIPLACPSAHHKPLACGSTSSYLALKTLMIHQ